MSDVEFIKKLKRRNMMIQSGRGLSIGNWVQVWYQDRLSPPMFITDISNIVTLKITSKQYESFDCEIDDIRGIPLSPLFLLKNGFEERSDLGITHYVCKIDDYIIIVEFTLNGSSASVAITTEKDSFMLCQLENIDYIHQLQNICGLYGINKVFKFYK